jgi:hypothetical protein
LEIVLKMHETHRGIDPKAIIQHTLRFSDEDECFQKFRYPVFDPNTYPNGNKPATGEKFLDYFGLFWFYNDFYLGYKTTKFHLMDIALIMV